MYKVEIVSAYAGPRLFDISPFKARIRGDTIAVLAKTSTGIEWPRRITIQARLCEGKIPANHLSRCVWTTVPPTP